jgi:ADP-heptose:LPS heptosyltransferase
MAAGPAPERPRILVIKHGALGDFILALGPFEAIRGHHLDAEIVLLTTPPFAALARSTGCFDQVWIDERAPVWRLGKLLALRKRLREAGFARVYDLQTSQRSSFYFRLFDAGRRPAWSGIAAGCAFPHDNPDRVRMHTVERQAEQLQLAGIGFVPRPDVAFLQSDVGRFGLRSPYVLLVPGGSAHRPAKRWPEAHYVALAERLIAAGIEPVLLGGDAEADMLRRIAQAVPATNLRGRTDFADIAGLARQARAAVGNDTGPMHIIAAAGCRTIVLFSNASNPRLCAPVGRAVTVLQRPALADLTIDAVAAALDMQGAANE